MSSPATLARLSQHRRTNGQFGHVVRAEVETTLVEGGVPSSYADLSHEWAIDDMEPGERRFLRHRNPAAIIANGYSVEYGSPLEGLDTHVGQEKMARYTTGRGPFPPIHLTTPPPGEESDGFTLVDGHHRLFAAMRAARGVDVMVHAPVLDEDGDPFYPSLPRRFGGEADC